MTKRKQSAKKSFAPTRASKSKKQASSTRGTGTKSRTKKKSATAAKGQRQSKSKAKPTGERQQPQECVVVGIGASAGGLEAFKTFLQAMPADSGLAFVLIQHLDPDHESLMADLLSKYTTMPVVQVSEATPVEPNRVYMIPPKKFIRLDDGGLLLDDPVKHRGMRMPIDYFFHSLAEHRRERAVAIILSGTGSDGTSGVKEVKAQGGMIMVQKPDTADYDGMPRSAQSTGLVDFICPIKEMPGKLIRYVRHPYLETGRDGEPTLLDTEPDHFRAIIDLLRAHTDYDFRCYKKGTLSRRIQRRMGLRQVEKIADYLSLLRKDRDEINLLFKDLLISVTTFFREKEAWDALQDEVIARIVQQKKFDQPVRVWVPACATGEEAYSVLMLLYEQFELQNKNLEMQLFATDLDDDAIDVARQGVYPDSIAADVSRSRLQRFFVEEGDRYRVNKRLRESSVFAVQNLIGDPPFSNLDLISCRNVMIYLEPHVQHKMIQMFHFALRETGYLFLGASESTGKHSKLFEPVSPAWRIYRKKGATQRGAANFPILPSSDRLAGPAQVDDADVDDAPYGSVEMAQKMLLEKFAPASVLINRKYEVQYFHGPVRNYLDIPSGEPTIDLTAMCLEGLRSKMRGVIHQALQEAQPASAIAPRVKRNGDSVAVRIDVEVLPRRRGADPMLLISFADNGTRKPSESRSQDNTSGDRPSEADQQQPSQIGDADSQPYLPSGAPSESDVDQSNLIQQLEYELQATREDLQSTIEELETSNEELKASNEEVMSMNEELQSTNEELETSREELQSLNEELSTVNSQLEEKVNELENTNNDLVNLLTSTEIATIFLDTDFRIRRYTPATTELLHVIPGDVGRPISDLSPRFNDENLFDDARAVLHKLAPIQREVCVQQRPEDEPAGSAASDGRRSALIRPLPSHQRWFIRRILPYRTSDNKIDGVVITFTDVSHLKESARRLEQREQQAAAVAELGKNALANESVKSLSEQAVQKLFETLDVEFCKVLQLQPDGKRLLILAGVGWNEGLVGQATVGSGLNSQAGFTLHSAGPVIVKDLKKEKRFSGPQLLIDHGVVSGMSVIIGREDEPWGVLGVHSKSSRDFSVDDVNFLQAVANVLSAAIRRQQAEQEVRDRERRLTLVTDAMPVLIAYCDRELIYRFCNSRYEDWFGIKPQDVIGKHVSDVLGGEAFQAVKPRIDRALAGERVSFEQPLSYRHGPKRYVRVQYIPDEDSGGNVIGYYAMIEDISERVKAEQARAQLAAIVEHSNDAIISKDLDGIVTSWNAAAERMYGYTADEMIGHSLTKICPDDRKHEIPTNLARIGKGEAVENFDTVRQRKDGSQLDVSITVSPICDAQGTAIGASAINRDVTARKAAELKLKELNETLEERVKERAGLITLLHDITAACHGASSIEDAISYVLREFSRYNGWCFGHAFRPSRTKPSQLVSFMDYYVGDAKRFERFRKATSRLRLKVGEGLPGRVYASRKPEYVFDLGSQAQSIPYRDAALEAGVKTAIAYPVLAGDEIVAVLEFFSDKAQEIDKRILEAMTSIGRQLGRVVERTAMQREIAELATEERQRIGSELHDTVIQQLAGSEMMAESLRLKLAGSDDEPAAANLVQTLKDAQKQVRRLHRGLMPVEVDAAGLMAALETLTSQTIEMHDVDCEFQCDEEVLVRDGMTATYLFRIAQEAVHNALKHADPTSITISLSGGDQIDLTIRDDGSGISGQPQTLVGSGLRIMQYRADVIGGRLKIESKQGEGTMITCTVAN